MNLKEIREIVKMLSGTDIAEFVLENEGVKLSLRKKDVFAPKFVAQPSPAPAPAAVAPAEMPIVPAALAHAASDNTVTIVAPMVGTFYRAPSPDAPPYVNIGDEVEVGQPLCIIEAMKLMNEIESEVEGKIVRIMAENAQPVEYGQPLFIIEPI